MLVPMVELRSRTHLHSQLHYIRATKDGSIKIVMNVDARGKLKLKFRQLIDVYTRDNIKDDELVPGSQLRVVRDLDNVSDITQGSCLFYAEVDIKTDSEDFKMTLENIRKQCKEKKRKLRNRQDTETASQVKVKQEYLTSQSEDEDGCDLEEPLSSWNTKFSKRRKKKQERKTKCVSTSSPSAKEVDLPTLCDVKPEALDDSCSVSEAMGIISADPLPNCNNEPESTTNTELVEEIMHDSSKVTRLASYCSAEPNSPRMVAIEEPLTTNPVDKAFKEASKKFNNARITRCCLADNIALEKQETVLCSSVSREETESEVPQTSESENTDCVKSLISSNTSSGCKENKEDEESKYSKPNLDMTITGSEIVKIKASEIHATDFSGLPIMDFGVENTETVWETEDIAKDSLPEATDIIQLTSCCNSLDNLHLDSDDRTTSLEVGQLRGSLQQSSASSHVDEEGDYKSSDSIQQQNLHNQPEKLLSGRKALSTISQAKLRKAMEHPDSHKKRTKKSKGKLYFSSQNSHRILKAEGLNNIDRVEVIPNSKQAIQKANNNQRARHKFPQATKSQHFSSGCTSLQGCTQKAIDFSQGQMRDFKYVAAKLKKELKLMRQITKRCLLAETNPSNMSECNLDEVKTLIRNAERTEKRSKKRVSVIERDCNRFCKLMGMVREDSPATENIVHKKKKIKFADDTGGDLCHVKVFEIDLESES